MTKTALIVQGGWEGHEPVQVAERFADILQEEGFRTEVSDTLDSFKDLDKLLGLNLIVPIWTMGEITDEQLKPVVKAVESGVGLAGCHGGMCDAFRQSVEWQFMTGSQWVAHPGNDGTEYEVRIVKDSNSSIVDGIDDFKVCTEQYYLHVDPSVHVLATTTFPITDGPHSTNGQIQMPIAYTKYWGAGRVFYHSIGHRAELFDISEVREMMRRGFIWAARKDGIDQ